MNYLGLSPFALFYAKNILRYTAFSLARYNK